jgi:type I restriction enzyme M protein
VLVVTRYFAKEQAAIEALQARQEAAARELEEFVEEHSGEEGLLADAVSDKGKVTKGAVKDRLEALANEAESDDERDALTACLALIEAESDAARAVKEAQDALDEKVLARYGKLSEAEIKMLVVEDKWLASLRAAVDGEVQRLTRQLAGRIKELEERYAQPLPALEREAEALGTKVEGHLKKMGLAWG